jgi:hypothetical protein
MHGLINKNYAWEFEIFRKIRDLDDGLSLFELKLEGSWYESDHNPSYRFHLVIANWTIVEFSIYNIHHIK